MKRNIKDRSVNIEKIFLIKPASAGFFVPEIRRIKNIQLPLTKIVL